MNDISQLQPYWLSKMTCPNHGKYTARTTDRPNSPVPCPECMTSWLLDESCKGHTKQSIPFVSKPRIPQDAKGAFIHSDKAPVRKRGKNL